MHGAIRPSGAFHFPTLTRSPHTKSAATTPTTYAVILIITTALFLLNTALLVAISSDLWRVPLSVSVQLAPERLVLVGAVFVLTTLAFVGVVRRILGEMGEAAARRRRGDVEAAAGAGAGAGAGGRAGEKEGWVVEEIVVTVEKN